jgi:hypothetical protein
MFQIPPLEMLRRKEGISTYKTTTTTLDDWMRSEGLLSESGQRISVLKLDCEGCEPAALMGAQELFRKNPPLAIITEGNFERFCCHIYHFIHIIMLYLMSRYTVRSHSSYSFRMCFKDYLLQDGAF